MEMLVTYDTGPQVLLKPLNILPKRGYLRHDYERRGVENVFSEALQDYLYRTSPKEQGRPETVDTYYKDHFNTLTPEWQMLLFRSFAYCAYGTLNPDDEQIEALKASWLFLIDDNRAWTNRHGPIAKGGEQEAHYSESIYGVNSGKPYFAMDSINSGGNTVRILGGPYTLRGEVWYKYETLDASKYPPSWELVNILTRPDLFPVSTILRWEQEAPQYIDGKMRPTTRVDPFSHISHPGGHWPFLSISPEGENYIKASRMRILKPNEPSPNPYNPARFLNR